MNAIKVARRAKSGGFTYHWLLDPGRTLCGRHTDTLDISEQLEMEKLPPVAACHGCVRALDEWAGDRLKHADDLLRVTAPSRGGTLRTTGPLSHGTRVQRSGRRL